MTGMELDSFATMVRKNFAARHAPGDMDDVQQEAALAVLETTKRTGLTLKGARPYFYEASVRQCAVAIRRQLAVVALTDHAMRQPGAAFAYQNRAPIRDRDYGRGYGADVGVRQADARAARRRLMAVLEGHLQAMPAPDRRRLRMLLGIGQPAQGYKEAAAQLQETPFKVHGAAVRFGTKVRKDKRARAARREMVEPWR